MRNRFIGVVAMLCVSGTAAWGQSATVWDGIYNDDQAGRGASKYAQYCAMCHGHDLQGSGEAPPLVGRFIPDWEGTTLADLFEKIQSTMPLFAPGTLSGGDTADILAYLLKANNFPAGAGALQAGGMLKSIAFETVSRSAKSTKSKPAKQ